MILSIIFSFCKGTHSVSQGGKRFIRVCCIIAALRANNEVGHLHSVQKGFYQADGECAPGHQKSSSQDKKDGDIGVFATQMSFLQ